MYSVVVFGMPFPFVLAAPLAPTALSGVRECFCSFATKKPSTL
jgi:hypothetical protein